MKRLAPALALVALALLPLAAERLRGAKVRCAHDGAAVRDAYAVCVVKEGGAESRFCGTRCAQEWLLRTGIAPRAILVTDAETGARIDARTATFVRNLASLDAGAPDEIRVFASREGARLHVRAFGGRILEGDEHPFRHAGPGRGAHARGAD